MITVRHARDFVSGELARLGRPSDPDAIFQRIRSITVAHLNVSPDKVQLDTSFVEDLGAD
jgi:hypothetical protein